MIENIKVVQRCYDCRNVKNGHLEQDIELLSKTNNDKVKDELAPLLNYMCEEPMRALIEGGNIYEAVSYLHYSHQNDYDMIEKTLELEGGLENLAKFVEEKVPEPGKSRFLSEIGKKISIKGNIILDLA